MTYVIACVITYFIGYVIAYVIAHVIAYFITYVIAYVITYPYAWTVTIDIQLRTYQLPIPSTSQASAWCYGRWMVKTEGSCAGLGQNFGRLNG